MTQPATGTPATDCLFNTIYGFLMPFFLASAGGNPDVARRAISELVQVYNAASITELDLVGRIIGFSIASLDNLRLSMTPDLPDTKVLRYRSNAVTLSRASDQARKVLEAVQENRPQPCEIPRPTVAAAPAPKPSQPAETPQPAPSPAATPRPAPPAHAQIAEFPSMDIEAMKRDARIMMNAFSKSAAKTGSAIPIIPDPAAAIKAAAGAAMTTARRASA